MPTIPVAQLRNREVLNWCPWAGSNCRPLPYQGSALPLSHMGVSTAIALNLEREAGIEPASSAWKAEVLPLNYSREPYPYPGGGSWIRTSVGVSQQIYSLPPLATRASLRRNVHSSRFFSWQIFFRKFTSGAAGGDRTHDPWLRRPILYPLSYSRYRCPLREQQKSTTKHLSTKFLFVQETAVILRFICICQTHSTPIL